VLRDDPTLVGSPQAVFVASLVVLRRCPYRRKARYLNQVRGQRERKGKILSQARPGLPPQPVQENLHPTRGLLDDDLFRCILVPVSLHSFKKDRRFVTAGIGEDRLTAGREQLWYEVGEGSSVLTLVEDVRGEDQVVGSNTPCIRFAPVQYRDFRFPVKVRAGIVGCEIESGLVVVCSKDFGTLGEREYGGQPDAAPQLDGVSTRKGAFREVTCQREAARPEFGPVREPLIAVEVFLADQVVRRDGVGNAVWPAPDLDRGFG
jgi:hypothetical protein